MLTEFSKINSLKTFILIFLQWKLQKICFVILFNCHRHVLFLQRRPRTFVFSYQHNYTQTGTVLQIWIPTLIPIYLSSELGIHRISFNQFYMFTKSGSRKFYLSFTNFCTTYGTGLLYALTVGSKMVRSSKDYLPYQILFLIKAASWSEWRYCSMSNKQTILFVLSFGCLNCVSSRKNSYQFRIVFLTTVVI